MPCSYLSVAIYIFFFFHLGVGVFGLTFFRLLSILEGGYECVSGNGYVGARAVVVDWFHRLIAYSVKVVRTIAEPRL